VQLLDHENPDSIFLLNIFLLRSVLVKQIKIKTYSLLEMSIFRYSYKWIAYTRAIQASLKKCFFAMIVEKTYAVKDFLRIECSEKVDLSLPCFIDFLCQYKVQI
jgi:hypothetical protein